MFFSSRLGIFFSLLSEKIIDLGLESFLTICIYLEIFLEINVFLIKVGNPIHAYNLIRRFSIDIGNIERDIQEDDWAGGKYKYKI